MQQTSGDGITAFASLLRRLRATLYGLLGVPDYARYVRHIQRHHTGASVLSEREFHVRATERRYGGTRPRCC